MLDDVSAIGDKSSRKLALQSKLMPLCMGIWSVLFILFGMVLGDVILTFLPDHVPLLFLTAHLPAEGTSFQLVFLRLCASSLPAGLLLSASGLTGFSKTVTALVLGWKGLSDGIALAMLRSLMIGQTDTENFFPYATLLAAIMLWILVRAFCRWALSVSARKTATEYYLISSEQAHAPRARTTVMRHLAITSGSFLGVTLACLGYGYVLMIIV